MTEHQPTPPNEQLSSTTSGAGRRVLILTAGFGEGHNAAARGVQKALEREAPSCEVMLLDPLNEGRPRVNSLVKKLYLLTIHRTPRLWKKLYTLSDQTTDVSRDPLMLLRRPKKIIEKAIREFHPDTIICTYPLYPLMLRRARLYKDGCRENKFQLCTVVTDSVTINSVWTRGAADAFFVTDPITARKFIEADIPEEKVHAFGFPVNPDFADVLAAHRGDDRDTIPPFRIALFPTGARNHAKILVEQLAAIPPSIAWRATIVLGKHESSLRPVVENIIAIHALGEQVKILGWTDQVPEILATHHLLCAKAGGATVHEARAAACPMLIHYIVPGQEEGNATLLESEGGGASLSSQNQFSKSIEALAKDDFKKWRAQRTAMRMIAAPHAAQEIARWVIAHPLLPQQNS